MSDGMGRIGLQPSIIGGTSSPSSGIHQNVNVNQIIASGVGKKSVVPDGHLQNYWL
ncbi:MAG: hypothetical protein LBG98_03995 [Puniceicoccales bacterium]|jgi:hypothetical protein|nr:hypothetical protein [Puniceicoccales bacterium]